MQAINLTHYAIKETITYYFGLENRIKKALQNKESFQGSYYNLHSFTSGTIFDRAIEPSHQALSPEQHAIILADVQSSIDGRIARHKDRLKLFNRYLVNIDVDTLKQALNSPDSVPSDIEIATYEEIQEIEQYIRLKYNPRKYVNTIKPKKKQNAISKQRESNVLQRLASFDMTAD
ncbi:hypothetical protein ACTQ54_03170 [Fundicoccus sp. Sow4_H7]|uniref:hypothetical protein n=1 Tax=Fundicoccus sp. Sow4_H7 TaxID=3438784 RepID=UPI003F911ACB